MRQLSVLKGAEAHPFVLPLAAHSGKEGDVEDQSEDTVCAHDYRFGCTGRCQSRSGTPRPAFVAEMRVEDARNRGLAELWFTLSLKMPVPRSFQLPSFSST